MSSLFLPLPPSFPVIFFASPKQWTRSTSKVSSVRVSYISFFSVTLPHPKSWHTLAVVLLVHSLSEYLLMHQPLRHADRYLRRERRKESNEWNESHKSKGRHDFTGVPVQPGCCWASQSLCGPSSDLAAKRPRPPHPRGVIRKDLNMEKVSYPRACEPVRPLPNGDIKEERGKKLSHHI